MSDLLIKSKISLTNSFCVWISQHFLTSQRNLFLFILFNNVFQTLIL